MGINMIKNINLYKYCRVIIVTLVLSILSLSPLTLANTGEKIEEITFKYTFHTPQLTTVRILDNHYHKIILFDAP